MHVEDKLNPESMSQGVLEKDVNLKKKLEKLEQSPASYLMKPAHISEFTVCN